MITLYTIPKAFVGRTRIHQDNAIASWRALGRDVEILLFGADEGIAEAAQRHGVTHEPRVACSRHGTPLVSDVMMQAERRARHALVGLVNTDMILLDDFLPALAQIAAAKPNFMMVASRYNLRIDEPLAFTDGWDRTLRARAKSEGRMYGAAGTDIFVYPRGLLGEIPPFIIGRGYWDNWLMYRARAVGAAMVDVTPAVVTVHQDHDYGHVRNLQGPTSSDAAVCATEEGQHNLRLAGGHRQLYTVYDASAVLTEEGRLRSTRAPRLIWRPAKAWLRRTVTALAAARRGAAAAG